jgi:nicotinate-nucleotide pyrophosphorylase (carboxylating)
LFLFLKVIFNLRNIRFRKLIKSRSIETNFPTKITYFSIIKIFYKMISDAQFKSELQILISNAIREDVGDHSSMACIPSSAQGTNY